MIRRDNRRMNRLYNNISVSVVLACVLLLICCKDMNAPFGNKDSDKILKFYSAEEPGRWYAQAADHDVKLNFIEDNKGKKGVEVSVPFTSEMSEQHYVEVIFLSDEKGNELAKTNFKRGEKARTLFELPAGAKYPLYVVAKCNMHEMWRKKITGREKPGDE
jgi:desulfoferrodoxin (superoxide reductase-like protein)